MITQIDISSIPCFVNAGQTLQPLGQITLIYGPNGSGKSSLAYELSKQAGESFDVHLFNQETISRLIASGDGLEGIVTFRDAAPAVQERLIALEGEGKTKGEIAVREAKVAGLESAIEVRKQKRRDESSEYANALWRQKASMPQELQFVFSGFNSSKAKLLNKVRELRGVSVSSSPVDVEMLMERARILSGNGVEEKVLLPQPAKAVDLTDGDIALLTSSLRIESKSSFGRLVEKLSNADWVRVGINYIGAAEGRCPFCQQEIDAEIDSCLKGLYSDSYMIQLAEVYRLQQREANSVEYYSEYCASLRARGYEESDAVFAAANVLLSKLRVRFKQIQEKCAQPGLSLEHDDLVVDVSVFTEAVIAENVRIESQNKMIRDRLRSKELLIGEVWGYFADVVCKPIVEKFEYSLDQLDVRIGELESELSTNKAKLDSIRVERDKLRDQLAGTESTVETINLTLASLGFHNFSLKYLGDERYKILRGDGRSANRTLSEGEKTLVSFLYFYNKIVAAAENQSAPGEMFVIIDDPVSSLDSEMLQYINLAIRQLLLRCASGNSRLSQIVLLTHNAYFYKEASYVPRNVKAGNRAYYILKKNGVFGSVWSHSAKCEIMSLYDELWGVVKEAALDPNGVVSPSLPNAMRRIVEHYFKLGGELPGASVIDLADEWEKPIMGALLAWYNDGSHSTPWDVDYSSISRSVGPYLTAFERLFELSGHKAHYDMMMGE